MSTTKNDSAYPEIQMAAGQIFHQPGLTKREYFAAMAMQGIIANNHHGPDEYVKQAAREAVQYADALIEQLNKQS